MTPEQVALLDDVVKTQRVRVLDVFLIGPLMVWGGTKLRDEYPVAGALLAAFGVSTVVYNAKNYLAVERAATQARR